MFKQSDSGTEISVLLQAGNDFGVDIQLAG